MKNSQDSGMVAIRQRVIRVAGFFAFLALALPAYSSSSAPLAINNNDTVVLHGNVSPLIQPNLAVSQAAPTLQMNHMILALKMDPAKQAALQQLLVEQQDPKSPNYHKWLTPEGFGKQFGQSPNVISAIENWLTSQGFTIDEVAKSGMWINFSGNASQVQAAFHTQINNYKINGQIRDANATDPSIPAALANLVSGIVSLNNIPKSPMYVRENKGSVNPNYTYYGYHELAPGDLATIYNINPLYTSGLDGTGVTIAIVGRTNPTSATTNWAYFRSTFSLPTNTPHIIVNGTDPGDQGPNEDGEADLDVEWSGAIAKKATIDFVVSASTYSTDGVDLSAQYIVSHNLAPVMSTSFGQCEALEGSTENAFWNSLWQQAASQGISAFVSSGDSGAAGCDSAGSSSAIYPRGVNGLASTPYNVAVGGTEFNEGSGTYWSSTNNSDGSSALSYIPEIAWNDSGDVSGGSGLWASSGGVSIVYSKPSWQSAPGVPADGMRDVPDVALTASGGNDPYRVYSQGSWEMVGGTSAASPSFAGIMALIVQKTGQRQGNANPRLYQLATAQYQSSGTAVFHDVTSGNNSVPGVTGFSAGTGYDQVTGLGSVDVHALVNNWAQATAKNMPWLSILLLN